MREIFTPGSVRRAPGNRCFYPEIDPQKALWIFYSLLWLESPFIIKISLASSFAVNLCWIVI